MRYIFYRLYISYIFFIRLLELIMNSLIQKFAAHYDCNLSLFGTLLVVAANNKQVKIKHFTTLPEQEQRRQLVLARNTLSIKERTKAVKVVVPPAVVVTPDDDALDMIQEPELPGYSNLPPYVVDITGAITGDAAYH